MKFMKLRLIHAAKKTIKTPDNQEAGLMVLIIESIQNIQYLQKPSVDQLDNSKNATKVVGTHCDFQI